MNGRKIRKLVIYIHILFGPIIILFYFISTLNMLISFKF